MWMDYAVHNSNIYAFGNLRKGVGFVEIIGVIIIRVQLVPFIGFIFSTEIVLRKNFDKNGERK